MIRYLFTCTSKSSFHGSPVRSILRVTVPPEKPIGDPHSEKSCGPPSKWLVLSNQNQARFITQLVRGVSISVSILLLLSCGGTKNSDKLKDCKQEVISSWPSGQPKVTAFILPETNEKIAEIEYYESKGTFREWHYEKGLRNGESFSFRPNGNPWSLNTYKNDTLDGPYKTWHENGQIYMEGNYRMGVRSGIWKFYKPNGEVSKEINFDTTDARP